MSVKTVAWLDFRLLMGLTFIRSWLEPQNDKHWNHFVLARWWWGGRGAVCWYLQAMCIPKFRICKLWSKTNWITHFVCHPIDRVICHALLHYFLVFSSTHSHTRSIHFPIAVFRFFASFALVFFNWEPFAGESIAKLCHSLLFFVHICEEFFLLLLITFQ